MNLVVALDLPTPKENWELVKGLHDPKLFWVKVGLNTFTAGGPEFVKNLKNLGLKIVLDLKLYDIPNTMASAACRIAELGVDMFTVHASAGHNALLEVKRAIQNFDTKMLAVTLLTSFSPTECKRLFHHEPQHFLLKCLLEAHVADGFVCGVPDLDIVHEQIQVLQNNEPNKTWIKFCPGIRFSDSKDDQNRKGNLNEAVMKGANFVVVGRPIYQAKNPAKMAVKVLNRIRDLEEKWKAFQEASIIQE